MSKKKNTGLKSKIQFSPTTPKNFDGSKNQFLLDDEAGVFDKPSYLSYKARCPDCGRFIKRGLQGWARHMEECPFFKKNKKASGILRYAERNSPKYQTQYLIPNGVDIDKLEKEYFESRHK